MRRLNVSISDVAAKKFDAFKKKHGLIIDVALDKILRELDI